MGINSQYCKSLLQDYINATQSSFWAHPGPAGQLAQSEITHFTGGAHPGPSRDVLLLFLRRLSKRAKKTGFYWNCFCSRGSLHSHDLISILNQDNIPVLGGEGCPSWENFPCNPFSKTEIVLLLTIEHIDQTAPTGSVSLWLTLDKECGNP